MQNNSLEKLSIQKIKYKKLDIYNKNEKPFLVLYLFIFIFGIILTIVSV